MKPLTTRAVLGALRDAGVQISTSSSTRVRGFRHQSAGAEVIKDGETKVQVRWHSGDYYRGTGAIAAEHDGLANKAADALRAAGLVAREHFEHDPPHLVVSRPE